MSAAQLTQQICCGLLTPTTSVVVGKLYSPVCYGLNRYRADQSTKFGTVIP